MLLKPFSNLWDISYLDFLKQNYVVNIPNIGLKKINLKGINRINESNFKDSKEIEEKQLVKRNFEDMDFSPTLINKNEMEAAKKLLDGRTSYESEDSEIKIQKLSFYDFGAIFSIEQLDILWMFEVKDDDLASGIDIINDSLNFSEKQDILEIFENSMLKFSKYLENPAKNFLLQEALKGFEKSVEGYKENPFAYFYLGLIYHRPTDLYDLKKSKDFFILSEKYAKEIENDLLVALCNFMIGWISYVEGDLDKAIEGSLKAIERDSILIPEAYYNLSKFYALKRESGKSIEYLDKVIDGLDNIYSLKADIDDDFKDIREELDNYFVELSKSGKEMVNSLLEEYGITIGELRT